MINQKKAKALRKRLREMGFVNKPAVMDSSGTLRYPASSFRRTYQSMKGAL